MASEPVDTTSTIVASATLRFPTNPRASSNPIVSRSSVDVSDFDTNPKTPETAAPTLSEGFTVSTPLTAADRSAKYHSVRLPSHFLFYPFKTLSVSLITGLQQAKFTRAAKEANLRYAIEAVTSTLGDGVNAMDLTAPDFFYVMYWLRLASYTRNDFTHRSVCRNPDHHHKVQAGDLPASTLTTIHVLRHTNIEETQLDINAVDEAMDALTNAGFPYKVGPSTMRDAAAYADTLPDMDFDHGDRQAAQQYEAVVSELEFLGNLACHLLPIQQIGEEHVTLSFAERCKLIETLSADHTQLLQDYVAAAGSYGIKETINVTCKECGAVTETEISVSAYAFF